MKLNLVLGIIMIAIAFVVFPIVLTGAAAILADVNIADYTGLSAVAKIAPLVVFVAMLFGGGMLTFQGVKQSRASRKSRR